MRVRRKEGSKLADAMNNSNFEIYKILKDFTITSGIMIFATSIDHTRCLKETIGEKTYRYMKFI